ncbi:FAD:protein FMN transferase [candidate division KSB1 bacterium]|nr:FAD:protein FMN transferase [candidate division KSB1 bacterium]
MIRTIIKATVFLFFVSLLTFGCAKKARYDLFTLNGGTMGTTFSIKIVTPKGSAPVERQIEEQIYVLLDTVNAQMSTYIKTSDISRFNAYTGTDLYKVSPELVYVIKNANRISELSGGAFDITVGPIVNLWGFGSEKRNIEIPPAEEIQKRLAFVGYQKLSFRLSPPALGKEIPQLYCDLAGIAKGYGVDVVADFIASKGYNNFLVEIGGEIRTGGINPSGEKWRVGISSPVTEPGIQKVIKVNNSGMATSGDYRNYFEKDGIRYSHTIDPGTGCPITHTLASVTVIHDTCMVADAIATAIDVMGPEKGYNFALKQNLLVFMIVKEQDGFVEKMTPGFEKLISTLRHGN